jgi:hypothetical protein
MRPSRSVQALLAGAILLMIAGCERSTLGPDPGRPQAGLLDGGLVPKLELLRCTPMAADTTVQAIGPAGGTLYVGPHALEVPAGALDSLVTITAVAPSDTVNRVRFAPEGLQFTRSALLTMSYANCNLLGTLLPKRVVYTDDALTILEVLLSVDHVFQRQVTGRLDHFSNYAVSW